MRAALLAALLAAPCGAQLGGSWRARRRVPVAHDDLLRGAAPPPAQRFAQRVDHLDPLSNASWPQRYWANESFWAGSNRTAVFLCVGGEGPALAPTVVVTGDSHCADAVGLAPRAGALLLALEHRFYGESFPAADVSVASLRLLSSRQALADVAAFLAYAAERYGFTPDTRVVAFGGSYPGNIAAWSRLRFPHLVHAAVASSAPVAAVLNFRGYNDAVGAALAHPGVGGDAACAAATRSAFAALGDALRTPAGRRSLEAAFPVCAPPLQARGVNATSSQPQPGGGPLDDSVAAAGLTEDLGELFPAQANDPACAQPACSIARVCAVMRGDAGNDAGADAADTSPLQRLAALAAVALPAGDCVGQGSVAAAIELGDITLAGGGGRVWLWQTCTEFGFYQTCDPDSSCPFTSSPWLNDLPSWAAVCRTAFGDAVASSTAAAVAAVATEYGGLRPGSSRVMYVNGEIDPWYAASVNAPPGQETPVLLVRGASHHPWTHPPKATDSPEIVAARVAIGAQVMAWLSVDAAAPPSGSDCGWADATPWGVAVNAGLACVPVGAAAVMLRLATRRQSAASATEGAAPPPALTALQAPMLVGDEAADAQQASP